jgi:hypothetical protein
MIDNKQVPGYMKMLNSSAIEFAHYPQGRRSGNRQSGIGVDVQCIHFYFALMYDRQGTL